MKQIDVKATIQEGMFYNTPAVVLDQYISPASVTYGYTGTGDVQVSITNPYPRENGNFVEADFVWATVPTSYPNAVGFLGQPYRAIRLTNAALDDTLTVIQAGMK
jgi:hypothetical protein